eukprot:jgi/Psemu1/60089/gm1.60089_g
MPFSIASTPVARLRVPRLALYLPLRLTTALSNAHDNATSMSSGLPAILESIRQLNNSDPISRHNSSHEGFSTNGLFVGVEASLLELGSDSAERRESCEALRSANLELIVDIDASIPASKINSTATAPTVSSPSSSSSRFVRDRVRSFESQLDAVSDLGTVVSHINCREREHEHNDPGTATQSSGHTDTNTDKNTAKPRSSYWNEDAALNYLVHALPLSARFLEDHPHVGRNGNETDVMGGSPPHLTGISHEITTRSQSRGMLDRPGTIRNLLEVLPPIRLSMDDAVLATVYSCRYHPSFGRVNDRSCDGDSVEEDEAKAEAFSLEILPHIDLVRTTPGRISSLSPLSSETKDGAVLSASAVEPHTHASSVWKEVWARKASRGVNQVFMILDDDDGGGGGDLLQHTGDVGDATATATATRTESRDTCNNNNNNNGSNQGMQRLMDSARNLHELFEDWSASNH